MRERKIDSKCHELLPVRQVHSMGSKLGQRSALGVGASLQ